MPSILLFVYGTLKRGGRQHRLLAGQQFLCQAQTQATYCLWQREDYPCLVADLQSGHSVHGELWSVNTDLLSELDAYEGDLFSRQEVLVENIAEPVYAYVYRGSLSGARRIGGIWPEERSRTGM